MVRHSADGQCLEFVHARDARHVWPQSLFQIRRNDRAAVFGREHAMVEATAIGVGHRVRIVILLISAVPLKGDLTHFSTLSRR